MGKAVVFGLLARETGEVRTTVVETRRKGELQKQVRTHVEEGSHVYTDALKSYEGLDEYTHKVIDHAEAYVDGAVHTNRMENFWSLLKRSICSVISTSNRFDLTRARRRTPSVSTKSSDAWAGSA